MHGNRQPQLEGDSGDFVRFPPIARGSGCGLEARVTMAARVGLMDGEAARTPPERIEKLKAPTPMLERPMSPPAPDSYYVIPTSYYLLVSSRVLTDPAHFRSATLSLYRHTGEGPTNSHHGAPHFPERGTSMSAHRAFIRKIRRDVDLFNTTDWVPFPALWRAPSVTVGKRAQLCVQIGSSPHIHSYPQALVHNALCATSSTHLFAGWMAICCRLSGGGCQQ